MPKWHKHDAAKKALKVHTFYYGFMELAWFAVGVAAAVSVSSMHRKKPKASADIRDGVVAGDCGQQKRGHQRAWCAARSARPGPRGLRRVGRVQGQQPFGRLVSGCVARRSLTHSLPADLVAHTHTHSTICIWLAFLFNTVVLALDFLAWRAAASPAVTNRDSVDETREVKA